MTADLPARARVVVVGGGVIGVSTASHLAEAGVRDVLLLDGRSLGSGSTCKAAGGVRAMFCDEVDVELGKRSLEAFARFGERPGQDIDLQRVGSLFLLDRPEHVHAMTEAVAMQNALGVPSRMIGSEEAQRLSPLLSTDGLLAAAWSPTDGHCTPESVVLGYATAARRLGATLVPHRAVTVRHRAGRRCHRGGDRTGDGRDRHRRLRRRPVVAAGGGDGRRGAARDTPAAPDRHHPSRSAAFRRTCR